MAMGLIGWVLLGVIVLGILYVIALYNKLVRLRALAKEGFSGITVQLRRRADLVPNLVETVKGYATHERETLDQVTARRADVTNASGVAATAAADNAMTAMLRQLFAVAEAYPELKANTNYLQLQDQLASIEGELQSSRRYYNATVRDLNSEVQSFPAMLVAKPLGFAEEPFYNDEDPAIQTAPQVSFAKPAA
jgi:LemA protein